MSFYNSQENIEKINKKQKQYIHFFESGHFIDIYNKILKSDIEIFSSESIKHNPEDYFLTIEEFNIFYKAIVSCVPSTIDYVDCDCDHEDCFCQIQEEYDENKNKLFYKSLTLDSFSGQGTCYLISKNN